MTMRKTFFLLALLLPLWCSASGASVRDAWLSMPDSLSPYLDKNLRQELVELHDLKVKAEVKNLLNGNSVMDSLTTDYLSVQLSPSATLQMQMLPTAGGDSMICLVRSYYGPAAESEVTLYHKDWTLVQTLNLTEGGVGAYVAKPDTMSSERFQTLTNYLSPLLVEAQLQPADATLLLRPSVPLASKIDRKAVEAIVTARKLKWTGREFSAR